MPDQPQLRYRDGPTTQADLVIGAPPPVVWALVCDIQLPSRFSSEFDGGEWLDGASRPALGARFTGRSHHPASGSWQTTSTICEFQPEQVLGWAVGDAFAHGVRGRRDQGRVDPAARRHPVLGRNAQRRR